METRLIELLTEFNLLKYRETLLAQDLDIRALAGLSEHDAAGVCAAWPKGAQIRFEQLRARLRQAAAQEPNQGSDGSPQAPNALDQALLDGLPTPLARALATVLRPTSPTTNEDVNRALDVLLRMLALVGKADYLHAPNWFDGEINDSFRELERPTLGTWRRFVDLIVRSARNKRHDCFLVELPETWRRCEHDKPWTDSGVLYDEIGQPVGRGIRIGQLEWLVSHRNAFAHDRIDHTDLELAERYRLRCIEAFREYRWLSRYELWLGAVEDAYLLRGLAVSRETPLEQLKGSREILLRRPGSSGQRRWETLPMPPLILGAAWVAGPDGDAKREGEVVLYSQLQKDLVYYTSGPGGPRHINVPTRQTLNELRKQQERKQFPRLSRSAITAEDLLRRVESASRRTLRILESTGKYRQSLHVERAAYEPRLDPWIYSTVPLLGLAAEAGAGKTGILASLVNRWMGKRDRPVLFLLANQYQGLADLDRILQEALILDADVSVQDVSQAVRGLAIVVDGLNEHPMRQDLLHRICTLAQVSLESNDGARFAISWRTEDCDWLEEELARTRLWWLPEDPSGARELQAVEQDQIQQAMLPKPNAVQQVPSEKPMDAQQTKPGEGADSARVGRTEAAAGTTDTADAEPAPAYGTGTNAASGRAKDTPEEGDPFVRVGPMTAQEHSQAWQRYQQDPALRMQPRFSLEELRAQDPELARSLRNPLRMRMFMECMHREPLTGELREQDVFSRYLEGLRVAHAQVDVQGLLTALGRIMYRNLSISIELHELERECHDLVYRREGTSALFVLEHRGVLSKTSDRDGRAYTFAIERVAEQVIGEYLAGLPEAATPSGLAEIAKRIAGGRFAQGPGAVQVALDQRMSACTRDDADDFLLGFIDSCPESLASLASSALEARILKSGQAGAALIVEMLLEDPTPSDVEVALRAAFRLRDRERHDLAVAFLEPWVTEERVSEAATDERYAQLAAEYVAAVARLLEGDPEDRDAEGVGRAQRVIEVLRHGADHGTSSVHLRELVNALSAAACADPASGLCDDPTGLLREAAEAARRRLAAFPGDDARDQAAGALEQLGTRLAQSGAHDEGERCLLEALSLHGGTRSSWSPCPALWQLAKICEHRGDASGALRHLRACADEELRRQWWWHAAITESRIGDVLQEAGNHDEAVRQHFKAVERARNSGNPPQHAIALGWLGSTLRRARRLPEALDAFERALHVAGSTPFIEPETKSDILEAKARVHSDLEDHDAAVSLRRQAIDLLRDSADRRRLVISLEHLGHALQRAGCHREAIEAFAESHELGTAPEPLDDWSPAVSLGGQAKSHVALGEFQPAIGLRLQIIDCMRSQGDRRGESIAVEHLGHTLREAGKDREAIEAYMRSHQVGMEPEPAEDWNPSVSLSYAATCHAKLGEFEPAVGLRARVAEISRASGDLREWALDLERLGDTLQEARRFDEALDAYRQALAAGIGPPEAEDWSAASVHAEIARVHEAREEWELALQARRHETDWCRDRGDRRSHAIAVEFLGHTLRKAGRVREAIEAYMESHRIGMVPEPVERWNPSISLNRAAGCHVELRDLDAAIGVRKQAIEASEARGDRRQLAIDLEFLGDTLREAERFDEALDAYRRALEAGLGPPAAEEWSAASVHSEIARVHEARGEWDLALQTRRQALEWRLRSDDRRATTVAHEYVAHALRELGRYREAIAEYMRSYEVGMEPETVGDWNPGVSLSFAATCHAELGEFDAAIVLRHQVIRISKAQGDRCECAIDLEQLGDTLREAKRYDEALDAYRQALETGLGPPMAEGWPADSVHAEIARVHEIRQEWDRAIDARRLQVDWCREHADRRAHAIALEFLGYTLRKAGRIREAIDAYMESHRIGMAPEPVERWNPSLSLRQCAQCHAEAGDLEAALAVRRQATRIGQDGGDRREWAIDLELLGDTLQEAERFDEALDAYRQALRAGLEPSIAEGWSAATVHTEIARVHEARQAWDSAVEAHRQALEWWQRSDDRRGRTIAHAFLAHALRKVGRQREAIAEYMRSHQVGMEPEPVERWDPGVSLKRAADCHATLGEFEAAIELLLRAVESDRARGDRRNHAIAMEALGRTYGEAGMHQEAVSAYLDSYRIGTSPEPVANWNPVIPLHLAAEECREHGDGETAVELAMQAMDCASACENQLWIALAALSLSESLESAGRDPDDVLAAATRAMQVAESNWLPGEGGPIGSRLLLGCANRIGRRLLARSGPCEALEAVESARAAAMEITESPSTASPGERAEAADWWQLQADGLGAIGDHAEARAAEARAAELRQ